MTCQATVPRRQVLLSLPLILLLGVHDFTVTICYISSATQNPVNSQDNSYTQRQEIVPYSCPVPSIQP